MALEHDFALHSAAPDALGDPLWIPRELVEVHEYLPAREVERLLEREYSVVGERLPVGTLQAELAELLQRVV